MEEVSILENGKEQRVTKETAFLKRIVNSALAGDKAYWRYLAKIMFELSQENEKDWNVPIRIRRIIDDVPLDEDDSLKVRADDDLQKKDKNL